MRLNVAMKHKILLLGKYMKEKSKYIGKYVNAFERFYVNLVFPAVTSGILTISFFISLIGAPGGLITSFITISDEN